MGIDARLLDDAADTAAGKLPVMHPVKIHAAGVAGVFLMRPFLLDAAELFSVQAEEYGADTACSGIHSHEGFCHRKPSFHRPATAGFRYMSGAFTRP